MNLDLAQKEFLKSEDGRKWFISKVLEAVPKERNWQCYHTPYELCKEMISKTIVEEKNILVLFNIEFIEILVNKFNINPVKITFIADCNLEFEMAKKLYKVKSFVCKNMEDIRRINIMFDLCFSNPPYGSFGKNVDLQILDSILPKCNEIVFIHPSNWILNNKQVQGTGNSIGKLKSRLENNLVSIYIFDGNKKLNIQKYTPCSITHIKKNHEGLIDVNYFDEDKYSCKSINDITVFGNSWFSIVLPFKNIIDLYLTKNGNIWDNRVRNIKNCSKEKFYCQFPGMRPADAEKTGKYMHYRLLNKGQTYIVNDINNLKSSQIIFEFDTKNEIENFLQYIQTNFACFCHAILKSNHHIDTGELQIVPWMDFTQEWTDEKLYKFFNIPQETIEYITRFFKQFD